MRAKRPSREKKIDHIMNGQKEDRHLRIDVDEEFHRAVKQASVNEKTSMKAIIVRAVRRYLEMDQ